MILGAPPLQVGQKLWRLLRGDPGATSQRSHSMADREIDALNERLVEPSEKPSPCKVAVRAASVPRRRVGVTRTNLRRR